MIDNPADASTPFLPEGIVEITVPIPDDTSVLIDELPEPTTPLIPAESPASVASAADPGTPDASTTGTAAPVTGSADEILPITGGPDPSPWLALGGLLVAAGAGLSAMSGRPRNGEASTPDAQAGE